MKTIKGSIRNRIIYKDDNVLLEAYPEAIHVWLFYHRLRGYVHESYWSERNGKYYERELSSGRATGRTVNTWNDIPKAAMEGFYEQIANYF